MVALLLTTAVLTHLALDLMGGAPWPSHFRTLAVATSSALTSQWQAVRQSQCWVFLHLLPSSVAALLIMHFNDSPSLDQALHFLHSFSLPHLIPCHSLGGSTVVCAHAFGHYHLLFPVFYFLPVIVPCANNTFYYFVFFVCTLYILVHAMLIDHSYCNSIRISYRNNRYIRRYCIYMFNSTPVSLPSACRWSREHTTSYSAVCSSGRVGKHVHLVQYCQRTEV